MVIQNIMTKFQNFVIFDTFVNIFNLSSAHVCHVESVNINKWNIEQVSEWNETNYLVICILSQHICLV